jgi:hypothetical protein
MRNRNLLILFLILNSVATLAAFGFTLVENVGWQIAFFTATKSTLTVLG